MQMAVHGYIVCVASQPSQMMTKHGLHVMVVMNGFIHRALDWMKTIWRALSRSCVKRASEYILIIM